MTFDDIIKAAKEAFETDNPFPRTRDWRDLTRDEKGAYLQDAHRALMPHD